MRAPRLSLTRAACALSTTAIVAYAAAVALPAHASGRADEKTDPGARIIDGQLARENPGAVTVLWEWSKDGKPQPQHIACTGTVVAQRWIMTANHCMPAPQEKEAWRMVFRVNSLKARSGGTVMSIDRWDKRYDIRLFHTTEPIPDAKIVKLASSDPPAGQTVTAYGWGSDSASSDKGVEDLKMVSARVGGSASDYGGGPSYTSTGTDGCAYKGDSGGPQFYNGEQVGVASTAAPSTKYMNYASVAKNKQWIDSVIGQAEPPTGGTAAPTNPSAPPKPPAAPAPPVPVPPAPAPPTPVPPAPAPPAPAPTPAPTGPAPVPPNPGGPGSWPTWVPGGNAPRP